MPTGSNNVVIDKDEMSKLADHFNNAAAHFGNIQDRIASIKETMESMYEGQASADVSNILTELYDHYELIEESHYQLEQFVRDVAFGMGEVDVNRQDRIGPAPEGASDR